MRRSPVLFEGGLGLTWTPLVALAFGAAGVEVGRVAGQGGMLGLPELVTLWMLSLLTTGALLGLAAVAVRGPAERRVGGAVAALVALHGLSAWRFGPMLNARSADPALLAGGVAILALAALIGAAVWRWSRVQPWLSGLALLVGLAALGGALVPTARSTGGAGPNLLLVTLDTTRVDKLAPWGGPVEVPALAALAAQGVRFDQAIAASPLTGPSHLSLLTGELPLTHGVYANGTSVDGVGGLLPLALQRAGWHTAGAVSGYPLHRRFGFDRGFDLYDADFSSLPGLHELALVRLYDAVARRNTPRERGGALTRQAVARWVASAPPEPWFLWVHLYDPHGPYLPPAGYGPDEPGATDGPAVEGLPAYWPEPLRRVTDLSWHERSYEGELAWTDHLLGEVLSLVRPAAAGEGLVVAVVADHGESMTEHGVLFDHGDDLYDPALRVPLVIAGEGVAPGVVSCQVPTVDLAPTLLGLLGVSDGVARDGVDQGGALRGGGCADRAALSSTVSARVPDPPVDHALRSPAAKVVLRGAGTSEFFDLAQDPGELHPLPQDPRAAAAEEALRNRIAVGAVPRQAEESAEPLLEALGYLEPR
ncbi:MAG: sulfatase [Deltaproteobacteria bacterium]|nr:sulfatase [Deltaproteobacteria bacterium]